MSAIRKDQTELASKFMAAFWGELVKPYYNSEDTDEYWSQVIDKIDDLYERFDLYENRQLVEMMFSFTDGL